MMFRRNKDGAIKPILLTTENTDYCIKLLDLFSSSINCKKSEIEDKLKILELKSQNPKFIKGLALLLFRNSNFERASNLDSEKVRESIFREVSHPAVSSEQKSKILERVSRIYNVSALDIEEAMYADKESESILKNVYNVDPDALAKQFNLEQLETILLKSVSVKITDAKNWQLIFKKVKSLGLLYSIEQENGALKAITVNGPVSILEQTERYGSKIALLLRFLTALHEWHIDAKIILKDSNKIKKEYLLSLNNSVLYYLPAEKINEPEVPVIKYNINLNPDPILIGDQIYFADYAVKIQNKIIYIDISKSIYSDRNRKIKDLMRLNNINWEIFYYLENNDKIIKGEQCFKNNIDWALISKYLTEKYDEKDEHNEIESIKRKIEELYPDSDQIIQYLEEQGYVPDQILKKMGYKLKWNGLKLTIL